MDQYRTYSSKYYFENVKGNDQVYEEEKERIRVFYKNKYNTNDEYKDKKRKTGFRILLQKKASAIAVAVA